MSQCVKNIRRRVIHRKTRCEETKSCTYDEKRRTAAVQHGDSARSAPGVLFRDAAMWWQADNQINLKGGTILRYEYLLEKHILPAFGDVLLSDISGQTINAFLNDKLKNGRLDGSGRLSPSYVRSIMLVVCAVLRYASGEGLCKPITSAIRKPPEIRKELRILSHDEQRRLEAILIRQPDPTKLGILISLYAGLRIGEVCGLNWTDIDLTTRTIHVRHTVARVSVDGSSGTILDRPKTATSFRCVPICCALYEILMEHSGVGFVASGQEGFVNPRTFAYRFHRLLKDAGIPLVNYHVLRHTFATRCIEKGVDVKTLSEVLGHKNAAITLNIYVHSSMDLKRRQLEKLSFLDSSTP